MTSRSLLLVIPVLLATSTPAVADYWYEYYDRGEKALQAENWAAAVQEFSDAIAKRGEPGVKVRTYGMNFINYHPFLKLGIAYHHLGQFDAALQAFDTERRLGAIEKSASDMKSLEEFTALARQARDAAAAAERERIAKTVADSLRQVSALERDGKLDEAIAALGRGLAVDPENAKAGAALVRLRARVAELEKERTAGARAAAFIEEGRNLIAAGNYQDASSALSQALSLRPDSAEAKDLLEGSQARLREEIEARRGAETRQALVRDGLAETVRQERAGRIAEALQTLQSVLAVDPKNAEALTLQTRLARAQVEAGQQARLVDETARLLREGEEHFEKGRYGQSLSSFNRVLALDPQNARAIGHVTRTYAEMNRRILGERAVARFPPAVTFTDLRDATDEAGTREQRVSSPDFVLSGMAVDTQPVQVAFYDGSDRIVHEARLDENKFGDTYVNSFQQRFRLSPGTATLKVVVTDPDGLTSQAEYQVTYLPPLMRSPWFYLALGVALLVLLAALYGLRVYRRHRLLKRRFNPYVAGAPVLNDDLFVGREVLLSRILQTIHNNSILLFGERRIGKTSLQHHLKKRLQRIEDPEYDFYPVYIDLQGTPQERFFATLADDVFTDLGEILDGAGVHREALGGKPYDYTAFVREIRRVLNALKRLSAKKKVKLILLIDEVDELNNYDPRINQRLRSLFMKSFAEDLVAVVSGVGIRKRWDSEGSPWYNFFEEVEVKPFTRKDAEDLIARPIRGVFRLEDGVVARIIDDTACKPYLIQKICVALVNRMHAQKRRRITIADVEAVGRPVET